jgi:hypothetical protein
LTISSVRRMQVLVRLGGVSINTSAIFIFVKMYFSGNTYYICLTFSCYLRLLCVCTCIFIGNFLKLSVICNTFLILIVWGNHNNLCLSFVSNIALKSDFHAWILFVTSTNIWILFCTLSISFVRSATIFLQSIAAVLFVSSKIFHVFWNAPAANRSLRNSFLLAFNLTTVRACTLSAQWNKKWFRHSQFREMKWYVVRIVTIWRSLVFRVMEFQFFPLILKENFIFIGKFIFRLHVIYVLRRLNTFV